MAEVIQKSLKKNAVLNVIKTLMGLIFPLITFPYASRILLPEGLGKVNFASSIVSYFAIISTLGIETYGIREAAKVRDDKIQLSQFTKEIFTINMISTVIAYILFIVAIIFVPKFIEYKILLIVTSSTILFTTIGINWLYSAVEDYGYITIRSIIFQFLSLILLFIFVKTKEDYIKYAAISVVSNVGSNILNFIHSRKYITLKTEIPMQFKKHLKPIFILFAMAVAVKIYTALDTTMLGFMKGDYEVGIYTAATKINKIVLSLVVAVTTVFMPRLSYYAKDEDKTKFNELVYQGFDILLLISVPCAIGLSLLSSSIISVFCGQNFDKAFLPMLIMNPIIVVIGISSYVGVNIFLSIGKEIYKLYSSIIGAVLNFCLNLILIPKFLSVGASISTLLAEITVTIVQIILLKNFFYLKPVLKSFGIYLINSLIMAIFVFLCVFFIRSDILKIIIGSVVGSLVYFVLLYIEKNSFLFRLLKIKGK